MSLGGCLAPLMCDGLCSAATPPPPDAACTTSYALVDSTALNSHLFAF